MNFKKLIYITVITATLAPLSISAMEIKQISGMDKMVCTKPCPSSTTKPLSPISTPANEKCKL